MVAEKIEKHLRHLEALARRGNGDLEVRIGAVIEAIRGEVERIEGFEGVALLSAPEAGKEERHDA